MISVRLERLDDHAAIREVNEQAFGRTAEADLIDALRREADPFLSLVAEIDERVIGHICFSPVEIAAEPAMERGSKAGERSARGILLMGLAPMAVLPEYQRQGIGSALARGGLSGCADLGAAGIVVLGHPEYYPRFGFRKAASFGLACEYDVPPDVFMALELIEGALDGLSGMVKYHPTFGSAE